MNETSKTIAFVISACLLGVAAGATHWMTRPKPVAGFEKVGEEFFPEFDDAVAAQSLEVMAYDGESDRVRDFSVKYEDGLWRIPSHHNYPAEAAERLARTATSVMGLNRESLVARRVSQHEKYGVIDPADPQATEESAGQRITLRDENGDPLVDYIIGKPAGSVAEDNDSMVRDLNQEDDYYYVRVPDEKEIYKARVEIDLSTRFADWINPDLLKIEKADDIKRLEIDNYELVENQVRTPLGTQVQVSRQTTGTQVLKREGVEPWQLEGLDPETEQLDELKVERLLTLLDSMRIAGVRPKLKYNGQLLVKSDLTINEELAKENPAAFQDRVYALQSELEFKGFTIGAEEAAPEKISLMASRGELRATTDQGVLYTLYFGRAVTGDESAIEIGAARSDDEADDASESGDDGSETGEPDDEKTAGAGDTETGDPETGDAAAGNSAENKSRYVAIRVDFDPAALGEVPVAPPEPVAPVKPEGYDEWRAKQDEMLKERNQETPPDDEDAGKQADDGKADDKQADPEETGAQDPDDVPPPPADIAAANDEKYRKYEQDLKEYGQASIQYATGLELYETARADYEAREKQGRERVAELNERFAEWYYVVPAESLEQLKLSREDLVTIRETPPPAANSPESPGSSQLPAAPNIEFPGKVPAETESPDETPESESPAASGENGEKSKADDDKANDADPPAESGDAAKSGESKKSGESDDKGKSGDAAPPGDDGLNMPPTQPPPGNVFR